MSDDRSSPRDDSMRYALWSTPSEHRRLLSTLANEVCRVIDAARAFVPSHFRPRADRARADRLTLVDACSPDGRRRLAFFHPLNERRDSVERACSDAATTVEHARHHEEACEFGS